MRCRLLPHEAALAQRKHEHLVLAHESQFPLPGPGLKPRFQVECNVDDMAAAGS